MEGAIIQELLTALPSQLNLVLVIGLLAIGFCIKNIPALAKVRNNLIPIILPVVSVIFTVISGNASDSAGVVNNVFSGLVSAAFAVWFHQTYKNIFSMLPGAGSLDPPNENNEKDIQN